MLKQLYAADGIAAAVEFRMHAAIRTVGDPANDTAYNCPDEDVGCPYTRYVLCAFSPNATISQQVEFLTCFDESDGEPAAKTKNCTAGAGLDLAAIEKCNAGAEGAALEHDAAVYFEGRFPDNAHSGHYLTPHLFVNDVEQPSDYNTILKALCDAGARAAGAGACPPAAAPRLRDYNGTCAPGICDGVDGPSGEKGTGECCQVTTGLYGCCWGKESCIPNIGCRC